MLLAHRDCIFICVLDDGFIVPELFSAYMEGLKSRIYEFLLKNKGREFTVEEIAKAINEERISVVKAQLTRLVKEGKVVKVGVDKYKVV